VEESLFEEFSARFVEAVGNLKTGDPMSQETEVSVMIDEANAKRVEAWVNEAVEQGATVLTGGSRTASFYSPTVLTRTRQEMKVCSLEVFGPVITLERFHAFDQAVEMVNAGRYGLQAGVFTNTLEEMNRAFSELCVGGVIINDVPTFRVDHMPYGGVKDSGLGREGIKYAMMDMMEPKILVKNF
jgi:glyceraldehyde-3-phosphate dehydrogenase (NADP+)